MSFVCSYCGSAHFEIDDLDHDVVTCQHCGMKQHLTAQGPGKYRLQSPRQQLLTCQQLLRCTDIVENIAFAAFMDTYYSHWHDDPDYRPDPVTDVPKSRSWLMTYCSIYRDLLEAVPEENEEGFALFSWLTDETDYDACTDAFLFRPAEPHLPPHDRGDYEHYDVEDFTPEQCAGAIVPRALLHQVPMGEIAAHVLLEYGWHGSDRTRPGSWLCIFKAAERRLAEMAAAHSPFRRRDPDETLAQSSRELLAEMQRHELTIEQVLEEFEMSFEQYDLFLKKVPHAADLLDKISLPDLRQTLQFLRSLGYTQEELCTLYTVSPQLMTWRFKRAKIGFTEQGAQMTRFMARLDPQNFEKLMERSLLLDQECSYQRLYIQATPDRIRYAVEQQLEIHLKTDSLLKLHH